MHLWFIPSEIILVEQNLAAWNHTHLKIHSIFLRSFWTWQSPVAHSHFGEQLLYVARLPFLSYNGVV